MDYIYIIKQRMDELGMTQRELSKKVGLSCNALSAMLNGRCHATYDNVIRIFDALGLEMQLTMKKSQAKPTLYSIDADLVSLKRQCYDMAMSLVSVTYAIDNLNKLIEGLGEK